MNDESKAATITADLQLTEDQSNCIRGTLDQVKCIAKGGMSYIFRARQPSLDRFIAVKKLRDELIGNPEMQERFRREAKALSSVLHQNVAHVYDFVEGRRESYIVMEYIDGIDVSTLIEKVGNLPPEVAAAILLGTARGLSYIHAHSLVHRDVKPSNIRVTTRGIVKLMDFGIVMDTTSDGLTRPGVMVGSPSYLSPEQVLGDPVTPRADIFLIGIVFYEMLTGTRPFKDEAGETVFQRIREAKYVPVKKMQPGVPAALARIVKKCLEVNPNHRYQTAKEVTSELEAFLGSEQSTHSEDLVLSFLDQEALLTPAVPLHEFQGEERKFKFAVSGWRLALTCLLLISFGLAGGYYFAGMVENSLKSSAPTDYPPPQRPKHHP